ncbi:MAG: cell division protein SepF [Actinobacteria bacterium]|nr:cell division protein SepF [Actinomycetota bacterium]
MSGFFKKTLSFFGLADEEDIETENETDNILPGRREIGELRQRGNNAGTTKRNSRKKVSLISSARESKKAKVFIAEPKEFDEIQEIADNFKNDIPIIVNLQSVDKDVSKRIIDFCSGLTYALEGDIKKVADRVFLIIPSNIEVRSKENEFLDEEGSPGPF